MKWHTCYPDFAAWSPSGLMPFPNDINTWASIPSHKEIGSASTQCNTGWWTGQWENIDHQTWFLASCPDLRSHWNTLAQPIQYKSASWTMTSTTPLALMHQDFALILSLSSLRACREVWVYWSFTEYVPEAKTKVCEGKLTVDGSRAPLSLPKPPQDAPANKYKYFDDSLAHAPILQGEAWMCKWREVVISS